MTWRKRDRQSVVSLPAFRHAHHFVIPRLILPIILDAIRLRRMSAGRILAPYVSREQVFSLVSKREIGIY